MRYLLAIALVLFTASAAPGGIPIVKVAVAPDLTAATVNRTTCVAPCSILGDATGVTYAAQTSKPFHELNYQWDFGDPNSTAAGVCGQPVVAGEGFWRCGANARASSKNKSYGPIVAHVFESPGTYTVSLLVRYGLVSAEKSFTVTVSDPEVVYAGANTYCVANGSSFTGCPIDCVALPSNCITGSDFPTAVSTLGTNKRVLLKRGDQWASSANVGITAVGPWTIGAFGTGNKPKVAATGDHVVYSYETGSSDGRVMDINIDGGGNTGANQLIGGGGTNSRQLMLRLDLANGSQGILLDFVGNTRLYDQYFLVDSTIKNFTKASSAGYLLYGQITKLAVLGNDWDTASLSGGHMIRIGYTQKSVFSFNTFVNGTGDNIKIHGPTASEVGGNYTEKVVVSENSLTGAATLNLWIAPQATFSAELIRDAIAERNYFPPGAPQQAAMYLEGTRITARNNLIDLTGTAGFQGIGVAADNNDSGSRSFDVRAYHNTCFSNTTMTGPHASDFACVFIDAAATDSVAQNNLGYAPNADAPSTVQHSGANFGLGTPVVSNNSSDAQTKTSPLFASSPPGTTPANWKPTSTSYAIGSNNGCTGAPCGTSVPVWVDFSGVPQPTLRGIGAMNP